MKPFQWQIAQLLFCFQDILIEKDEQLGNKGGCFQIFSC